MQALQEDRHEDLQRAVGDGDQKDEPQADARRAASEKASVGSSGAGRAAIDRQDQHQGCDGAGEQPDLRQRAGRDGHQRHGGDRDADQRHAQARHARAFAGCGAARQGPPGDQRQDAAIAVTAKKAPRQSP